MKISIIGAGNVGATCAMRILEAGIADIALLDVVESIAKGKAEDLMDAASLIGHNKTIFGTSNYDDTKESDIIVITAGFARKPGMTREELLAKNASVVKEVTKNVVKKSKNPIIIVVTNPLDVMTQVAYKESGLSDKRVFGMAGILDSARMNLMIHRALKAPLKNIDSVVLGTHGETMVPLQGESKVNGKSLQAAAGKEDFLKIIEKTKNRGAEIVNYLGQGSAYYAPSAGVFRMIKAICENTKEIIATSCFLKGEYGIKDIYLGVPAILGKNGIEKILEVSLSSDEKTLLQAAANSVKQQIQSLS